MSPRPVGPLTIVRLAGMTIVLVLFGCLLSQHVTLAIKAIAVVSLVAAVARPVWGLLIFAGLSPLTSAIVLVLGSAGAGVTLLEALALAAVAGALLRPSAGRTRIGWPAALVAAVAVASAASVLPAQAAPLFIFDRHVAWQLAQDFQQRIYDFWEIWQPVLLALFTAIGALLGWAVERTIRQDRASAERLLFASVAGHAGAGALNIARVITGGVRSGGVWHALPGILMNARFSAQTDLNAAGSLLVLALVAGIGLSFGSIVRRIFVTALLVITGAGLWITGSRAAMIGGLLGIGAGVAWLLARRLRYRSLVLTAGGALIVATAAWAVVHYPAGRNGSTVDTMSSRLVMMRAGMRVFDQSPVFGIGVMQFIKASGAAAGIDLTPIAGRASENAHNNFVQILAEQGIVGFLAMLGVLGLVLGGAVRAEWTASEGRRLWVLGGLIATIATWMTGHPLLVAEYTIVFWFYCGLLAGLTPALPTRAVAPTFALATAGVLLSVPLRATAIRDAAELEHRGIGVPAIWQHDDSQRYREVGSTFSLFLPAMGQIAIVPLRIVPGGPDTMTVDLRLGGQLINTVALAGSAWQDCVITLRPGSRRYERVDFDVHVPAGGSPRERLLRVGKDVAK